MPAFLYSYAMELLKFREAGVEVILKASSSYLDSAVILYTAVYGSIFIICLLNVSGFQKQVGPANPCILQLI